MKTIIIIGGAPCTGKTTLAKELSEKLSCPWISTDVIRSWMKKMVSKNEFPNIFNFAASTAEEYYSNHNADESIADEQKRDEEVFKGVKHFIEVNEDWETFIIEGISVYPKHIKELEKMDVKIISMFLIDTNAERIHQILHSRGLWGPAESYEDWVKDIEEEYLRKTNDNYLAECKRLSYQYHVISKNRSSTTQEVEQYILEKLHMKPDN